VTEHTDEPPSDALITHYGTYPGAPLAPWYRSDLEERVAQQERDLRQAKDLIFLLADRLGGMVEITEEEQLTMDPTWALVTWRNPATNGFIVQCRKPKKDGVDLTIRLAEGRDQL
jgi:hypothetical protein